MLVDPPCSGLGTLQARPDLRWRASPAAIGEMRERPVPHIGLWRARLRPGGVLVYSTCTISPIENERLIADFLASHPDFGLDDLAAEMPDFAMRPSAHGADRPLPGDGSALLTLPHRHDTAGFFIARLRRS